MTEKPTVGIEGKALTIYQYEPSFAIVEAAARDSVALNDTDVVSGEYNFTGFPQMAELDSLMITSPDVSMTSKAIGLKLGDAQGQFSGYGFYKGAERKGTFSGFHNGKIAVMDDKGIIEFYETDGALLFPSKENIKVGLEGHLHPDKRLGMVFKTQGLDWSFAYNAMIGEDTLDLVGEYVITNNSGADFKDIDVRLVSGRVVVQRRDARYRMVPIMEEETIDSMLCELSDDTMSSEEAQITRQQMPKFNRQVHDTLDLVIDKLPGKLTLENNSSISVPILPFKNVPYKKEFVYDRSRFGGEVAISLSFENNKENNMGMRLLPGNVSFYVDAGRAGYAQTALGMIYPGETGRIKIGALSSLVVEDKSDGKLNNFHIKNHSTEDRELIVTEMVGKRLTIKDAKIDGKGVGTEREGREEKIRVNVPANTEVGLVYSVAKPGLLSRLTGR